MNLEIIKDKVTGIFRTMSPEELEEHVEATPNRASIRYYRRSLRLKGPGYTRAMRKGRTQRGANGAE